MAEQNSNSIFRQSAMSRISSAEDLDKYIKVTNPSAWVTLVAGLSFIIALLIWSATATVPYTISTAGVAVSSRNVWFYVDAKIANELESNWSKGDVSVKVANTKVTSISVSMSQKTRQEIEAEVDSAAITSTLGLAEFNNLVAVTTDDDMPIGVNATDEYLIVPVEVTVMESHPIALVFGH